MRAMILAAGLGTRLKPLTDKIPKALVEIGGVPMLQRLILNLKAQGFNSFIVNVHHFASQVKDFLNTHDFGVKIIVSDETDCLLDTGGGIVKALPNLFDGEEDIVLIHNVDILSNADLKILDLGAGMGNEDCRLLVSNRESSRKLIFDENMCLTGWHDLKTNKLKPDGFELKDKYKELAFSGIYSLRRKCVEEMKYLMGEGKFSVMDYFLNPMRKCKVMGVMQPDFEIVDIGKPATLLQAEKLFNSQI